MTGVQTCALPIYARVPDASPERRTALARVAGGRLDRLERLLDPGSAARRDRLVEVARSVYRDPAFDSTSAAEVLLECAKERAEHARAIEEARIAQLDLPEKEAEQRIKRAQRGAERDELLAQLEQQTAIGQRTMELDYDIYAEGEAELGWLNSQVALEADAPFELDGFLIDLISRLHRQFVAANAETAHLKTIGTCDGGYAVANAVSNHTQPELSLPSACSTKQARIVINARVATDPEGLATIVRQQVAEVCNAVNARHDITTLQSFRPGRPVPTHRITAKMDS